MNFKPTIDCGTRLFEYSFYPGSSKPKHTLHLPINVLSREKVNELADRVASYHNIPCFATDDLKSDLQKYKNKELISIQDACGSSMVEWIQNNPHMVSEIAQAVANKYSKTWAEYAEAGVSASNEFAQAYHYLIHSPAMSILLELEQKYHKIISKVNSDERMSLKNLQERQQMEMSRACEHVGFAYTNDDVSRIAAKHVDEIERLQKHWSDNYEKITRHEKNEFRSVVIELCEEMKNCNDQIPDHSNAHAKIKKMINDLDKQLLTTSSYHESPYGDDVINDDAMSVTSPQASSASGSLVQMEESFTINLGAQLKTMHNIRLLVTDMLNFCHYADDSEMEAQRFQTVMSLYSNSLSAIILLTDDQLDYKTGAEEKFSSICHSSNEFHFSTLDEQIEKIQQVVIDTNNTRCRDEHNDVASERNSEMAKESRSADLQRMVEGDFYVTKHSNLSQAHVVFHLVSQESQLRSKNSNINSRHAVITGLRHILKVASDYEIKTITLPLLLTHELTDDMTPQWCIKRAELVMKCMKGFMMEAATWDGGISRTVQFVIPPGVSENVFDRLRSVLPEVFRTTSSRILTSQRQHPVSS